MYKQNILSNLIMIARQPFMFFTDEMREKGDNAFETLRLLSDEEKVTAGRIAEYLDIKPSSVTQIKKKLEDIITAKGVKSEEDTRVTYVLIKKKGLGHIKDEIFKSLQDNETETLNTYLKHIVENINSHDFKEQMDEIFGDDRRWKQFNRMSSHFGRAREHMIDRGDFNREFHVRFGNDSMFWGRGKR